MTRIFCIHHPQTINRNNPEYPVVETLALRRPKFPPPGKCVWGGGALEGGEPFQTPAQVRQREKKRAPYDIIPYVQVLVHTEKAAASNAHGNNLSSRMGWLVGWSVQFDEAVVTQFH